MLNGNAMHVLRFSKRFVSSLSFRLRLFYDHGVQPAFERFLTPVTYVPMLAKYPTRPDVTPAYLCRQLDMKAPY